MSDSQKYIYAINANDRIDYVNEAFEQFARENDAGELTDGAVIGRSLWSFITPNGVEEYYRVLLNNVRETGESLTIPYQCDSPSLRRSMRMRISSESGEIVQFTSWLEKSESREPIFALSSKTNKSERLIHMCSWCKKVGMPGKHWETLETALEDNPDLVHEPYPRFSHGICSNCLAHQEKSLKKVKE